MNKRAVILSTTIAFCFALVALRLADLMLVNHERLSEKAVSQYSGTRNLLANRGRIYDRRGRELAVNVDVMSAYASPQDMESPGKAASDLARLTGRGYRNLLRLVSTDKSFVWIERKVDLKTAERIRSSGIKGIGLLPEVKRFYPKGTLASHIIGFVGIDNQALEGLELKYDDSLRGKEEEVSVIRDARGNLLSEGKGAQPGGSSLVLTVDEGLQYIVEKALDGAMQQWKPSSATAIMMDPFTGEVLAMANRPTYDPNTPAEYKAQARRNRALTDSYEPGSTFKIITMAGALEKGLVKPTSKFDCSEGFIRVGRKAIWDTHKNGVITLSEVVKASSNVGTVQVAGILGKENLYEYVRRFRFGEKTGIDLPGEAQGKVEPLRRWSDTSSAFTSIGYGVAATPLQVLRAYSAIANGGYLVRPHVVSEVISPEGAVLYRFKDEILEKVVSTRTAHMLKEMLVGVTEDGGTAPGASVGGNRVAGKTGTARLLDPETGRYSRELYASSFVGFAPADNPRIALVVLLYEPKGEYYGGQVAAPLFHEIVNQSLSYLDVPREDRFDEEFKTARAKVY